MSEDLSRILIDNNQPSSDESLTAFGAALSLAKLFEGNVQHQLAANNVMLATSTACVNAILGAGRAGMNIKTDI